MIFLGAGASAPFDMATSPELTKKLDELLIDREPDLLQNIKTNLKNRGRDYNYENVLKLVFVVTNRTLIPRNDWTQSFPNDYGVKGDYSDIIDKMFDIIYDDLTSPLNEKSNKFLTHEKIEKIFNLTYDLLIGVPIMNKELNFIFTTNYDPSLEFWCQKRNIYCHDGTDKQENPDWSRYTSDIAFFLNLTNVQDRQIAGSIEEIVPLIRLHGSLLKYQTISGSIIKFNRLKENLSYPDLYKNFILQRPLIILPGREHLVRGGAWASFHNFYETNLIGDCLFIGYSFRHDEINERIKYNFNNKIINRLGVFAPDPEKNLKNLFENENIPDAIVRIKGKFGSKKGMDEFIDKWWPSISRDVFYDSVTAWLRSRNEVFRRVSASALS